MQILKKFSFFIDEEKEEEKTLFLSIGQELQKYNDEHLTYKILTFNDDNKTISVFDLEKGVEINYVPVNKMRPKLNPESFAFGQLVIINKADSPLYTAQIEVKIDENQYKTTKGIYNKTKIIPYDEHLLKLIMKNRRHEITEKYQAKINQLIIQRGLEIKDLTEINFNENKLKDFLYEKRI